VIVRFKRSILKKGTKLMSYRRKSLEELTNILHTYKQGVVERFGPSAHEDLVALIDESLAVKKKEYFNAIFGTMHPADMAKTKDLLKILDEAPKQLGEELKGEELKQDCHKDGEVFLSSSVQDKPKRGRPRKHG
jgi:hypothetical protein